MKLTASDRSALIKLAGSLPSGSEERRAILAGLKSAAYSGPGGVTLFFPVQVGDSPGTYSLFENTGGGYKAGTGYSRGGRVENLSLQQLASVLDQVASSEEGEAIRHSSSGVGRNIATLADKGYVADVMYSTTNAWRVDKNRNPKKTVPLA